MKFYNFQFFSKDHLQNKYRFTNASQYLNKHQIHHAKKISPLQNYSPLLNFSTNLLLSSNVATSPKLTLSKYKSSQNLLALLQISFHKQFTYQQKYSICKYCFSKTFRLLLKFGLIK